ncbi:hypothetical protein F6Y02_36610 [Bacillus megaterium]|nr:hypothetical protein [Priestia megaterium]
MENQTRSDFCYWDERRFRLCGYVRLAVDWRAGEDSCGKSGIGETAGA